MNPDVRFTLGPVLGGALLSTALFGSMCLQTILYVKQYPNDPKRLKALTNHRFFWFDTTQTGCIVSLSYQYLVLNFGSPEIHDHVFLTVVASLLFTALLTFIVNGFFAHKVHKLSRSNWWLTGPTLFCMISRLALAFVTVTRLATLKSFALYGRSFAPLLTTALALSAITDMILTGGLCYYLRTLNPELSRSKKMLSTIVNFADNNGALTCIIALSTLICWVTMPSHLFYLGIHFTIGKCYSNSLLGTLNMRNYVKRSATSTEDTINIMNPLSLHQRSAPGRVPNHWQGLDLYEEERPKDASVEGVAPLEIKVERIVKCD